MTQHEKILKLHEHGGWVCQNTYRANYIYSPHKRRIEIEGRKNRNEIPKGKYVFEERKCQHGSPGVKDFLMKPNPHYQGATQITQTPTTVNQLF